MDSLNVSGDTTGALIKNSQKPGKKDERRKIEFEDLNERIHEKETD